MSNTAARLQSYYAAEARILEAQETRHGDRQRRNTELLAVQAAIKELEAKLAAENAAASGRYGPAIMVADFSRRLG